MKKKHQFINVKIGNNDLHYGNTGCGIFKGGAKINCSKIRLLNFENWSSGELSKIGQHFGK